MRLLFLCSSNINRSRTAEVYFSQKYPHFKIESAGLNEKSCRDAGTVFVTEAMIHRADLVFVMEEKHISWIIKATGERFRTKLVNLNIPDIYQFMDNALIEILIQKTKDRIPH